jgi:hypothetical protein
MKLRTVLYAGVAMTALLAANSAMADVFVQAEIDKTKDITVTQRVTINKTIRLDVTVSVLPEKAAEADGIINQVNSNNEGCGNCAEKRDEIIGSIIGDTGIVNVNQSAGNMNNQGNAVSVAVDAIKDPPTVPPPPPGQPPLDPGGSGFANSQAHIEQVNGGEEENEGGFEDGNLVDTVNLLFRDAVISNSINGNLGIVNVNQSAGTANNQANQVAVAISLLDDDDEAGGGVALAEADLGQVNAFNVVQESDSDPTSTSNPLLGINKSVLIDGSINGNRGIVNVNQGAGNMANQANNVSAAAVVVR